MNSAVKEDIVLYSELSKTEVDKNILNQKFNEFYKEIGIFGLVGIVVALLVIVIVIAKR